MNEKAIRIINGKEIPCMISKFDWREMEMELVPFNQNDARDVHNDFSVGYQAIDDMPQLDFSWRGKTYSAKSSCSGFNSSINGLDSAKLCLYNLQCKDNLQHGDRILFYIPHYPNKAFWEEVTYWSDKQNGFSPWQQDLCRLKINERDWIIRKAMLDPNSNIPKPYDLLPYPSKSAVFCGCFLETHIQECETVPFLFDMAKAICRLEGLSVGHFIMWQTAWISRSNEYFLFSASSIRTSSQQFYAVHTIKNVPDISPGCIISSTINNYLIDKDTWDPILYWFLASLYNASYVHVALHLQFPLLERIVDNAFLALSEGFTDEKIATDDFKVALRAARKKVKEILGEDKSIAQSEFSEIDKLLRFWTKNTKNGPAYKDKIILIFQYAGYTLSEAEIEELSERNALAHSVYMRTGDPLEIHHLFISVTQKTYALLLAMLGYGGSFCIFNSRFHIENLLPKYSKISLPSLRKAGRQCRLELKA